MMVIKAWAPIGGGTKEYREFVEEENIEGALGRVSKLYNAWIVKTLEEYESGQRIRQLTKEAALKKQQSKHNEFDAIFPLVQSLVELAASAGLTRFYVFNLDFNFIHWDNDEFWDAVASKLDIDYSGWSSELKWAP